VNEGRRRAKLQTAAVDDDRFWSDSQEKKEQRARKGHTQLGEVGRRGGWTFQSSGDGGMLRAKVGIDVCRESSSLCAESRKWQWYLHLEAGVKGPRLRTGRHSGGPVHDRMWERDWWTNCEPVCGSGGVRKEERFEQPRVGTYWRWGGNRGAWMVQRRSWPGKWAGVGWWVRLAELGWACSLAGRMTGWSGRRELW
jgi:hypothetical protein